jgi:filamentous hemagglutinin
VIGEKAEDIKRDVVGRKNGSKYDLYVDKETGEIFVLGKGGKGGPQPTGLKLPK